MRLLTVPLAMVLFLAACGDDSAQESATPSSAPSLTVTGSASASPLPGTVACTVSNLEGVYISTEGAAGHQFLTFTVTNRENECKLAGPPVPSWYTSERSELDIPFTSNVTCKANDTDFSTCVSDQPVFLPPPFFSLPIGVSYAALVVVSVANIGLLEPCESVTAHYAGFNFGGKEDMLVALPQDIELQSCSPQVVLHGYGPLKTGDPAPAPSPSPTVSNVITWSDAKALFQGCEVAGVMQAHSLDIYLTLDDGTELHAIEPGIDDIFAVIDALPSECGPRTVATD